MALDPRSQARQNALMAMQDNSLVPQWRRPLRETIGPYLQEVATGAVRGAIRAPGELLDLALGASTAGAPMSREEAQAPLPEVPMIPVGHGFLPSLAPQQGPGMPAAGFLGELASPDPLDFLKVAGALSPLLTRGAGVGAWHGGPHKFKKFSTDKIGTGEGAQAYGHGLYFSSKKEVAQSYRKTLSQQNTDVEPIVRRIFPDRKFNPEERAEVFKAAGTTEDPLRAAKYIQYRKSSLRDVDTEQLAEAVREARSAAQGALYKVDLAPDDADLLDWDLPLSKQSEKVRESLKQYSKELESTDIVTGVISEKGMTGERAYKRLERLVEKTSAGRGKEGASKLLNQAGIPGIRYKDQLSRGKEAGTYNYVIFDDKLVDIMPETKTPRGTFHATPRRKEYTGAMTAARGKEPVTMTRPQYDRRLNAMDRPFAQRAREVAELQVPTVEEMDAFLAAVPGATALPDAEFRRAFEEFRRTRR